MGLYRRLSDIDDRAGIDAFAAELIDRFGDLPDETSNLLKIVEIKLEFLLRHGFALLPNGSHN